MTSIKNLDEKISEQTEKLRQLKERKAKQERQLRATLKKQERAKDTRRKILLGALWLQKLKNGDEKVREKTLSQLDTFLTKAADRELFGLEPLQNRQD